MWIKKPIGLLSYDGCVPVGWCSIAPRGDFRNLSGDESLENVWSLVCFYIKKEYRKQGLTEQLVRAALDYAKQNGVAFVEAYPVDPDSPSCRFMRFKPFFKKWVSSSNTKPESDGM